MTNLFPYSIVLFPHGESHEHCSTHQINFCYSILFLLIFRYRFPWKLHIMLDAMNKGERDKSIVCWQPHGRAFMVHKPKDFVSEVMSQFFNQTKYASFQRQLNLYGFSRLTHGPDKGSYYHRCFISGQRHLCKGMVRQRIKGTKNRKSLSPEEEPNFYAENYNSNNLQQQQFIIPESVNSSFFNQSLCNDKSSIVSSDSVKSSNPLQESLVSHVPSMFTMKTTRTPSTSMSTNSLSSAITSSTSEDAGPTASTFNSSKSELTALHSFQHENSISHIPRIVSPRNSTTDCNHTSVQMIKGGDLLFFEGQPFRYLEHFKQVPRATKKGVQSAGACTTDYSSTQMIYSTTSTDKFHDMISNIVYNMDPSSSCSPKYQHDVRALNTFCTV